jgi:N-acetylglucosamine-6-phosphate deacetylase
MAALGMPPGQYRLNEFTVSVNNGRCRLADGTIAGSVLPLNVAVRNLLRFTGCTLSEALATVTSTPAKLLGSDHERGRVAPGYLADLLLLSSDLEVQTAFSAGQIVYQA